MKIGILQTAYKKSKDYGAFYNVQELGLARALTRLGHEVILYKAVDGEGKTSSEYDGRLTVKLLSVRYLGINGLIDLKSLDRSIDKLIYFCDTQLKLPAVYNWCEANGIQLIPYVGVIESHSENSVKRFIMDIITRRNLRVFRKCNVLAKTPVMVEGLEKIGCNKVTLFPVGLDESVMHFVNSDTDIKVANQESKKLLFIGRMEEEKQPLEMIRLYEEAVKVNSKTNLVMIGDGHMYDQTAKALEEVIGKYGLLDEQARIIRKVPYSEMYSYYEWADLYVNLNMVEILGMSILEAMYYACPVLAITAPGPEFILHMSETDDYCGIVSPDMEALEEVLKMIVSGHINRDELGRLANLANKRVKTDFVWDALAHKLIELIGK